MAGQPRDCASVGAGNDVVNHVRTGSLKPSRGSMQEGYERTVTGSVEVGAEEAGAALGFACQKKNTTAGTRYAQ